MNNPVSIYKIPGLVLVLIGALGGCVDIGPRMVEAGRLEYNMALQRGEDQQLLLNLVRLRYRDRPFYLETTSLATQFSIQPGLSALAKFGSGDIDEDLLLNGGVALESQPTVTYAPLQGEDFSRRMLTPIPLRTVVLLANSGWSIERILRLMAQRMNGLPNAPSAAGPTPTLAPEYTAFAEAARLLRDLQQRDLIVLAFTGQDGEPCLQVRSQGKAFASFKRLAALLQLDPSHECYVLTTEVTVGDGGSIGLQLRSLTGVMYFVSQAVTVPQADLDAGRVTRTMGQDGAPFDWRNITARLMQVAVADDTPVNAAVAVKYRDAWFYLDDSDLDSKSTFNLISQLFSLQASQGDGEAPLLTLPLGG